MTGGRGEPPIGGSKVGDVFVIFLKNLLNYIMFAVIREVNFYFFSSQGAVEISSKSIAKSVINKYKLYGQIS